MITNAEYIPTSQQPTANAKAGLPVAIVSLSVVIVQHGLAVAGLCYRVGALSLAV